MYPGLTPAFKELRSNCNLISLFGKEITESCYPVAAGATVWSEVIYQSNLILLWEDLLQCEAGSQTLRISLVLKLHGQIHTLIPKEYLEILKIITELL